MKSFNEMINVDVESINDELKQKYQEKLSDNVFSLITDQLELDEPYLNIAEIEHSINEKNNCIECKRLSDCKNLIHGHCYNIASEGGKLTESYVKCRYLENVQYLDNIYLYGKSVDDIEVQGTFFKDEARVDVMNYIKEIIDSGHLNHKGIYLSGTFGSGKSYIMNVFIKRLAKANFKCGLVYYPEMLVQIRRNFNTNSDILEKLKLLDVLIIDDIGAESLSSWNRDEILGTILQYRMEHKLFTCFTSNYNIKELELHFSSDKEVIKAKRVIDRIDFLTKSFNIISKNYRK